MENFKNILQKRWYAIALLFIVLLGFWLRSFPARYGELQALDPFYLYRTSEDILHNNFQLPELDTMRYYPRGVNHWETEYMIPVYLPALIYASLGGLGMHYLDFAILFPAIMGALTVFVGYFVGKEFFDRKAGLFTAFFLATVPAFIIRTSAGFFEKEPIAGVFIMLTIYLFVKAFRKNSWSYGILAGLSLAALSGTWGGTKFIYMIFGGFIGLLFIGSIILAVLDYLFSGFKNSIKKVEGYLDIKMIKAYVPMILLGTLLVQLEPRHESLFSSASILAYGVLTLLLVRYGAKRFKLVKEENLPYVIPVIIVIGFLGLLIGSVFFDPFAGIMDQLISAAIPGKGLIGTTVAENAPGDWGIIYSRTNNAFSGPLLPGVSIPGFLNGFSNTFIFTLWGLSLLGIALLVYKFFRTQNWILLFPLFWILGSFWSVFNFIRLVFLVGPAASLVGAFFMSWIIDKGISIEKKFGSLKRVVVLRGKEKTIGLISVLLAVFVFFTLLFNYSSAYSFSRSLGPSICFPDSSLLIDGKKCLVIDENGNITLSPNQPWYQAMNFFSNQTPENAVVLSWWDFGYWFQTRGHRPSIADGGNLYGEVNHDIAEWYTADSSTWNENNSITEFFPYLEETKPPLYILMDYTLPGKYGAISKIASYGEQIVGFLQFQQTGSFQKDNKTIMELKAGQYTIWIPVDSTGDITSSPIFLISDGNQYYSKTYINDICTTTNGITHISDQEPSIGGCVSISPLGVYYIPDVAENSIFVNLMFMNGYGLPVEKVFDNQYIIIYKVRY